jgi:hypothetical protein
MKTETSAIGLYALPLDEYHRLHRPGYKYPVEKVIAGKRSDTKVKLHNIMEHMSVSMFEFFDEDGNSVDIHKDVELNPYIQYKMA